MLVISIFDDVSQSSQNFCSNFTFDILYIAHNYPVDDSICINAIDVLDVLS